MRYTVLGSGGAVGRSLAEIVPKEIELRLVSRHPKAVQGREELFCADLLSKEETNKAIKGSDIVFVLLGLEYKTEIWQAQWPTIMHNIIEASSEFKSKIIFFDNVYMYGKVEGWMDEETAINPCSKKGEVRAEIAQTLLDASSSQKVQALIARSADFYGPGADKTFAQPMIFDKVYKGASPMWLMNSNFKHSLTFTPDAAKGLLALAQAKDDVWNQVWHLPTDSKVVTGKEFMNKVSQSFEVEEKFTTLKPWMITMAAWFDPMVKETKEMLYQFDSPYLFDSRKFEKRFFMATAYEDGIKKTVEYIKNIQEEF